ncbi:hypothetical protein ILUMI_11877 [Ignelater luminosus]|uniref:C-type lectin domain-containing protein n=1 Tax=Ignelater luminosus TaxID=2038154 RepID=A0A8K0G7B3_IGNLU|nr:hypothetical protein ILUMI_11877 [Ignelater luminosus]
MKPSEHGVIDCFEVDKVHYRLIKADMTHSGAVKLCRTFKEELVIIKDIELATVLAEALSESNLMMDSLWTAAKLDPDNEWRWHSSAENTSLPVSKEIKEKFVYHKKIKRNDRRCLAFSRNNHDEPQFRPLPCEGNRAVFCQRPARGPSLSESTHPGWIKIGPREYKIFWPRVTWEGAREKCVQTDINADLAVFVNFEDAQQVSRFLLIGRPSFERAWIGGKWEDNNYVFVSESLALANITDNSGYPPWLYRKIRKFGATSRVLLDRHLDNTTLFIEEKHDRLHPYICYKGTIDDNNTFQDFVFQNYSYRLYFTKKEWNAARDTCEKILFDYGSYLVEIKEKIQFAHLMYIMGENKTEIQHVWVGGRFIKHAWTWVHSNQTIATANDSILHWVRNTSYAPSVERSYVCLVTDRENHLVPINYGTICETKHYFICQFEQKNLRRLQEDENGVAQLNIV